MYGSYRCNVTVITETLESETPSGDGRTMGVQTSLEDFMNRQTFALAVGLGVALCPLTSQAQHHHGHHHGNHFGHSNWNYVVPHSHHHHGAYYVANNAYYYTPSPVVRVVSSQVQTQIPVVQQPVELKYGTFARCDDLAGRLERELNQMCLELHYNYGHNSGFAHTYREAYGLLQSAKQIHQLEHQGNRDAIRASVGQLDEGFHHVQEEMASFSRQATRPIGSGDLGEEVSAAEAILHHLCYDVGVKPHDAGEEQAPPPGGGLEQAPPPRP